MKCNRSGNKLFVIAFVLIIFPTLCINAQDTTKGGFLQNSKTMNQRWELGAVNHKGLFLITSYRPVYVTAGRLSNDPNEQPTSENLFYSLPFKVPYNNYEAKFQLSFKTKVATNLFWGAGDVWVAYAQKAHW